jgi:subtilisin family serine protease
MRRPLLFLATSLFLFLLVFPLASWAQTSYYWADGQPVALTEDHSSVVIHFEAAGQAEQLAQQLSTRAAQLPVAVHSLQQRAIVGLPQAAASLADAARALGLDPGSVRSMAFAYTLDDGFQLWPTHEIALQLAPSHTLADLQRFLQRYPARYLQEEFGTHIIEVTDILQVAAIANALQENGLARWATPDWYAEVTHTNDPLFSEQFQMHNTGQTIDGFAGTADADCNALEAWSITLGSSSITVAVIDDGMENHEDMNTSGGASRIIGGYTPVNGGNGSPNASGAHGQACGGIIAASHNGIGVQGVAPNVNLLTVNIFEGGETTQDLANAITWAKNNGADVLSNSWGYNSCTFSATNLTNALNDADANGRGGLGCVIAFSSGNSYGSCVSYPAYVNSVIAVGAFGNDGIKSDYSNAGTALDLSGPSNDVSSQGFLSGAGVRTTDRMGSAGYSSGNYTTSFGGTSASCPVVAGVAALVLSVDATLTSAAVKNILYSTAKDFGPTGRDNDYGWGAVDAFAAVQAAGGGGSPPSSCSSTVSSFPYGESFESGLGAWTQASGDDFNWARRSGGTPSSGTGPSAAADGSFYMYVEASSPNYPSLTTIFESPCFDLSSLSSPELSFQYHMLGNAVGTLDLQASTDGSSWTSVWSLSGDQGSSWNGATVSLAAYAGQAETRLRFVGTTSSSWQGDMCVDALNLSDNTGGGGPGCQDNEVTLTLVTDNYPAETTWELRDGSTVLASGGPYGTSGATYTETFCLPDGCYDFVIFDSYGDGICCAYGSGSYTLTDASSNVLASGGAFGSSETANFCVGSTPPPSCPAIDFSATTINSYGGTQDNGSFQVQDGGATLFIENNAWKSISYPYTVTANTVLEFDFRSTIQGEIHGLGFDNNNSISSGFTFRVYGTQNWGIGNYDTYPGGGG